MMNPVPTTRSIAVRGTSAEEVRAGLATLPGSIINGWRVERISPFTPATVPFQDKYRDGIWTIVALCDCQAL